MAIYTPAGKSFAVRPGTMGRVVNICSRSVAVMSDIWEQHEYAVVWAPTPENPFAFSEMYVQSTDCYSRGSLSSQDYADVDASDEVLARYGVKEAMKRAEEADKRLEKEKAEALEEARQLERGKRVRVVKGRKVPVGTVGTVGWCGKTQYGWRVGLDVNGERIWVAYENLEVVEDKAAETAAVRRVEQGVTGICAKLARENAVKAWSEFESVYGKAA